MLVEKITSKQNPLIRRLRRVRAGNETHHVFVEGVRLVEDALQAGVHFESVAFTPALETTERGARLLDNLAHIPCRGAFITQQILAAIADTESPQGVVAVVSRPHRDLEEVFDGPRQLLVIADGLQDPGNLGSIVRTAEAAGASGLITTRQTVDPFNVKALRASMGSAFRLPIAAHVKRDNLLRVCKERGVKLIATRPQTRPLLEDAARLHTVLTYTEADLTAALAFVLGREATGISEDLAAQAEEFLHVPMAEGVESLNVAAAATVLLYEAARQRGFTFNNPVNQPVRDDERQKEGGSVV